MTPSQGIESTHSMLQWLNDYGALQLFTILFIIRVMLDPAIFCWTILKIGKPIAKIADWLDEHKDKP